jgi:hypothetical protein
VAAAAFGGAPGLAAVAHAVSGVPDDELAALVVEAHLLDPELVDHVVAAGATTPSRCAALAGCLLAHGADEGAVQLAAHAVELSSTPLASAALRSWLAPDERVHLAQLARASGFDQLATAVAE